MNFRQKKLFQGLLLAACVISSGAASASVVRFTDNGSRGANLGHTFTEMNDGVTVKVSAFKFSGSNSSPSSAGASDTFMKAYGRYGIGIGGGGNPEHAAENRNGREFFLIEFDQMVNLNKISISEWGNRQIGRYGLPVGGDSDVDYWGGVGTFDFDNLGSLYEDDIPSDRLSNGQSRNITVDSGLGNVNWLLLGPEAFNSSSSNNVHDFIKLRAINYNVAAVPLPASVWLMGSALVALAGLNRRRKLALA